MSAARPAAAPAVAAPDLAAPAVVASSVAAPDLAAPAVAASSVATTALAVSAAGPSASATRTPANAANAAAPSPPSLSTTNPTTCTTPDQALDLAHRVGQALFASDAVSRQFMGMELLACEPGRATLRMTVRSEHLNGHRTCHGGMLFTLADSTFAFACNSRNHTTVASGCSIEYLRPAHAGDVLTAQGQEQTLSGRHGVYDVTITNHKGQVVALFRGKSTQIQGQVLAPP